MNFPGAHAGGEQDGADFEVTLEDGTERASESEAKPRMLLVVIPRGVRFRVDEESVPGAICVKIALEAPR
jgi:hypothetical protein